jgi:plastocyanin
MRAIALICLLSLTRVASPASQVSVTLHLHYTGERAENSRNAQSVHGTAQTRTIVWLTPVNKQQAGASAPPPRSFTMVQQDKTFIPHILVIPVGSTVAFPNKDPFFHNVFSLFNGKRFDLGLYQSGQSRDVAFNRVGVSYIFCNIHPEMSAVILALDTPYFGSPDTHNEVKISGIPEGAYTLQAWSEAASPEALKALTRQVSITSGANDLGDISIPTSPRELSKHLNKFGEPYDTHQPLTY